MNTDELVERLRAKVDSGRKTLGGGSVSADGKVTTWGYEPIMVYRNPDGPAAADEIERLTARAEAAEAENAKLREALQFYADPANHRYNPVTGCDNVSAESGDTARAALGGEHEHG